MDKEKGIFIEGMFRLNNEGKITGGAKAYVNPDQDMVMTTDGPAMRAHIEATDDEAKNALRAYLNNLGLPFVDYDPRRSVTLTDSASRPFGMPRRWNTNWEPTGPKPIWKVEAKNPEVE